MATITTTPLSHTCAPGASRSRVWRAGFRPSRDRPRRWSSVFKSLTFNFMICCFVRSSGSRSELDIRVRAERRLLFSFRVDRRFLPLVSVNGRSMRLVCDLKPSFKQSGQHHSKMSELTMQSSSTKYHQGIQYGCGMPSCRMSSLIGLLLLRILGRHRYSHQC